MGATLDDVKLTLDRIEASLGGIANKLVITGHQVNATNLSEITQDLGLVRAGEFRTGQGEPGAGFDGVRIAWPPMTYNAADWNIVGVSNDVLQFGLSATNGKAYAGAGAVILDSDGITLRSVVSAGLITANAIKFVNPFSTSEYDVVIDSRVLSPSQTQQFQIDCGLYDLDGSYNRAIGIGCWGYDTRSADVLISAGSASQAGYMRVTADEASGYSSIAMYGDRFGFFGDGVGAIMRVDFEYADVAHWTGWIAETLTWTYATSGSFTVPGDQTARFHWGTKIWAVQTTNKFFYVNAPSTYSGGTGLTTVTITGWGVYSLANAAITAAYYSYEYLPQGWTFKTPTVLPIHGGFYADDISVAVTCTNANTYYQVASGMTTQACNIMTYVANYGVRVVEPGIYLVTWSMTVSCSSNLQDVEGAVMLQSTGQVQTASAGKTQTAGDLLAIGGTGLVTCATADVLSLCVANETSAGTTVTVNMANLTAIRVGN